MPALSSDVDSIIRSKERSVSRIEAMLDTLLGIIPWGFGEQEFRKLNGYYAAFIDNCVSYISLARNYLIRKLRLKAGYNLRNLR